MKRGRDRDRHCLTADGTDVDTHCLFVIIVSFIGLFCISAETEADTAEGTDADTGTHRELVSRSIDTEVLDRSRTCSRTL